MSIHNHPDTETLSAFLDGEAPAVESHVASCAECRQELDALARVRSAVGAPVRPPDENRKDTAIAAAVGAMPAQSSGQNWRWRLVAGVGAAAAVIVIGVVVARVSASPDEATARWQGTPADVFGFSPPGAPATSSPGRPAPMRVYVLARSDCRLLVFQSYAP